MTRFGGLVRWLADWRTGATFAATCLVLLLGFVVVDGRQARDQALGGLAAQANEARSAQEAATRHIDLLTGEVQNLRSELDAVLAATTDEQRRQAVADADARRTATGTTTTVPASSPRPSPGPEPATTTTTTPPPPATTAPTAPTTAPCTTLPVVGGCVPRASRGGARTELDWEALRACESGGDYANKNNPTYRGAYQFSYSTWASVGGEGDPADAPPDEQDMRARMLYERSGAGQWPVCGRYL